MNHEGMIEGHQEMTAKAEKTLQNLEESIRGIRLGMITPSFIDTFKVPYYGTETPIKHLASTTSQNGLVLVRPHDPVILGTIQNVLKGAGLNAYLFSKQVVAVSVPPICGEERERVKIRVKKLGEDAKIAIRSLRKSERKSDKSLSEDQRRASDKEIQEITDLYISEIDRVITDKLEVLSC